MFSAYLNLRPANSLVNVFATATAPSFSSIHGSQGIHKREGEALLKARVRSQHLYRAFITQRNGVVSVGPILAEKFELLTPGPLT